MWPALIHECIEGQLKLGVNWRNFNVGSLGFGHGSGRYLLMVYREPYLIKLGASQIFSACMHLQLTCTG